MTAAVALPRLWLRREGAATMRFTQRLAAGIHAIRAPRLLRTPPPGTVYLHPERHGVAVIALPAARLHRRDLASLGQASARAADPLAGSADDLHLMAGVPKTGEILCHTIVTTLPAPAGCTLGTPGRPLFAVERLHGAGAHALPPGLPVARVRELTPLVFNRNPAASRLQVTRAVMELGAAAVRLLTGPLGPDVDAVIGEMARHPFGYLTRDLVRELPRVTAVEAALDLRGQAALLALLRLKQECYTSR